MIPALDIERIDFTHDKLGFTLHLRSDLDTRNYNEIESEEVERKGSFWKKVNPFSSDKESFDDRFPMNFESEHVQ